MKILYFQAKNRFKALKGNLHFGKIVLALLLIFTMVIGNLNLSMASSNTKTMTIEFEEQLEGQSRSKTVTIPNLKNIVSVKTNTGNVTKSISGDKVTINVSGGSPSKSINNPTKYSKIVTDSKTSVTNSFPNSITYNSEGYSGTLSKDGSSRVISGEAGGSKTVTHKIGPQESTSFSSTYNYSSGGYSGTLSKDGSHYKDGSKTDSKIVTDSRTSTNNSFDSTIRYNSGGYIGNLYKNGDAVENKTKYDSSERTGVSLMYTWWPDTPRFDAGVRVITNKTNDKVAIYYYVTDWSPNAEENPYSEKYSSWHRIVSGAKYSVEKVKIDSTRYDLHLVETIPAGTVIDYTQNYIGTVTKTTPLYSQNYRGTVIKPDTRVWRQDYTGTAYKAGTDNYYKYTVTIEYIDNSDPTIKITLPIEKGYFGKEEGYNTIPLEVYVKDSDIGDTLKAYYRINGTKGQAGIQFGGSITANGTNQKLTGTIPKETVTNLSEGTHKLYMWVEDNKGGKSAEVVRNINIDKTAPNGFTPTVIANSISEITISGTTSDGSSGMHETPYSFRIGNNEWDNWAKETSKKYTGLLTNTKYDLAMKARDKVGNIRIETISKYTLAAIPEIEITKASDTTITGKVNPKSNPTDTKYKIEYSLDNNTWNRINGRNEWDVSLNFTATNLQPGKKYYIRVKAKNGDGTETDYSNIESETTKPAAPILNTPIAIDANTIKLTWNNVESAKKYHVEYKSSASDSWIKVEGISDNYITISNLNANEQYEFRIKAENNTGLSSDSKIEKKYTKALNPVKIILDDVTGTSLSFNIINDDANTVKPPETNLKLEGIRETGWGRNEDKVFNNLVPGRKYELSVNIKNEDNEDNGWLSVPGDIQMEDKFGNPISEIVTIVPVKDFKVTGSSVNTITVSWEKADNQEYQVFLEDESGNEVSGSRSKWLSSNTHTFINLPHPNTKYIPYIITRRGTSELPEIKKVENDHKAFTNAEGVSRGTFESGEDYIIITLNVNNNNPSDTEYKIKNDVTGQETTVKHSDPTWKNTNLSRESFYTYSVKVENKNKELSYFTRLMFEDGDEAHTELPNIDIPPKMIVPDEDFINLDELKDKDHGYEIGFNPEDLNGKLVQLEEEKYRVTQNRIEEIENAEEIEVINYSYSKEGFGYTDWKPLEKGKFKEKLIFNTPGIYKTHWKFKNYKIESNPALINYYADWIKPTVEGEPFIKGQSAVTGNEFKVNVKAEDNVSPYLFYSTDNGSTWHLLKEGHNIITFTNIQKTSKGIQNKLTIKIADIAGNVVEKTFTVWGIEK